MTNEALTKRREYQRQYRLKQKEQINKKQREWRNNNKDKIKQYNVNYWTKKTIAY